jgi:hypothetical protein
LINQTCVSSTSGTIEIVVNNPGTDTFIGTGTATISSITYPIDSESISFNERYKQWGEGGLFITFMVLQTLFMIGVAFTSPAVSVILTVIGLVGAIIGTIFFVSWGPMITFIIIGGITLYIVTRRNT